ncbi:MAG: hemolysin family protein [Spirochaetes bacterium]|nr:hemolysin family protein [Spirochaetota bacterium]
MFSLSSTKIEELKRKYPKRGGMIEFLLKSPQKLLITILICNIMANIFAAIIARRIFYYHFHIQNYLVVIITTTIIILIFGEVTPKTLAMKLAPSISLIVAPIFVTLMQTLSPFIYIFRKITHSLVEFNSLLFYHNAKESTDYNTEEMLDLVNESRKQGIVNETEGDIIENIIDFSQIDIKKLMKPRNEIFTLPIDTPILDSINKVKEKKYSRIPIWEDNEENIAGILSIKELLKINGTKRKISYYRKYLQKPVFIPENMKAETLLKFFQTTESHLALVIDEYGGISGLITFEDILEGIIGDVVDKEDIKPLYHIYNPYMIEAEARMELSEFNRVFHTQLKCDDAVSLGGYILERLRRIPQTGEIILLDSLQFKISGAKNHKIESIQVTKPRKMNKKKGKI